MPKKSKFQVRSDTSRQQWQARDDRKEAFWRQHSDSWEKSGLSKSAYCREHQLTYSCFLYWRKEIEVRDGEQWSKTKAAGLLAEVPEIAANPFVPIRFLSEALKEEPSEAPSQNVTSQQQIEIVLPGGAIIRLNDACNAGFVAELLSALKV